MCVPPTRTLASCSVPTEVQAGTPGEGEWAHGQFGRKMKRLEGLLVAWCSWGWQKCFTHLSGSEDADAISPHEWSNISCQPGSPEAYGRLVVQTCQGSHTTRVLVVLSLPGLWRNSGVWGKGSFVVACDDYERNWIWHIPLESHNLSDFWHFRG